jgi:proteasome assembly chaperone (PAC2) family protein
MPVDYLRILEAPELRNPAMVAAFAGWNDASEVATYSTRFLVSQWSTRKLAEIDGEEFFDFTETRPTVRIAGRFQRRIEWPANDLYYYLNPDGERDYVVLVGVEPQLRWKTFTKTIADFAKQLGVTTLITLGGLIADVPHTLPIRLSGTSNTPKIAQELRRIGVEPTRYEGPTGIVGVLNAACADIGIHTGSIWGSVPDYLSATPNVKVAGAILDRLNALLHLGLDLTELKLIESQFDRQVNEALAENPEVQAYVHELEERANVGEVEGEEIKPSLENFPSSDSLIRELEDFLRRRQKGQGGNQPS